MPFSMSARNALISFQYRQRYQEGYNCITSKYTLSEKAVSIPTTVSGGLQFLQDSLLTEAGKTFQYRQRYQEGYNIDDDDCIVSTNSRFNTDNGIRRATMLL